jgi:hypothetical protein
MPGASSDWPISRAIAAPGVDAALAGEAVRPKEAVGLLGSASSTSGLLMGRVKLLRYGYLAARTGKSMKALILPLVATVVVGSSITSYGQQAAPPTASRTCSQTVGQCSQTNRNASYHKLCRGECQRKYTDCMSTGLWVGLNGQKYQREKQ